MTDFEKVIDFDNMYKAYCKSKSGKGFKKSFVAVFGERKEIFQFLLVHMMH